ncbi:hypothetical protein [Microbispora sp. GKU 823]|uniref:hypothetical protein n=1 Tax=Microbispora sp. GKU 823 TaxID=1652100 RepID=UPI00117CF69D|nr:hypothetical protein [Microbispora sp. GKU 823]
MWIDTPGLTCVSLLAVTVWCVARRGAPVKPAAPVALAAAILTVPAVLARVGTMPWGSTGVIGLNATLQLAVLLASGITLALIGVRALRTEDGSLTEVPGQPG